MKIREKPRLYKIGQLARTCNISRATIMRFEEDGLLRPAYINSENGYRYYDSSNLAEVIKILKFQRLGFTKKEIRNMDNPEKIHDSVRRMQQQFLLLLNELEDLTAREDIPDTIHIRMAETPGGNYFSRQKELIYTPENIRSFAISTMEDFMETRATGNTQQAMRIFIDAPTPDNGGAPSEVIGCFDGRLHTCNCIIPTSGTYSGSDFIDLKSFTALTLVCKCDYNNSANLFHRIRSEALARGLTPHTPVEIAGFPEIFFSSDKYMSNSTLRLVLGTRE
ncbi:MAG: MerR family transcriptional regulator [Bacillota bacterium]|nr:MerR family transcriptional regulator [Bacillota bacterium]